jgi:FKBP-type peptidyl-prolyl cis-trans isomerase FkpA
MKICKIFLSLLLVSMMMFSCMQENRCPYADQQYTASSSEISYLQNYLSDQNITDAIQHPSGVFYKIHQSGNGPSPELCSSMLVTYQAYRLGFTTPFDQFNDSTGIPFILGTLITGIQKVMPSIKAGSSVTLYIPPSLGYGGQDQRDQLGNILLPANSYIRFDMFLKSVQ